MIQYKIHFVLNYYNPDYETYLTTESIKNDLYTMN